MTIYSSSLRDYVYVDSDQEVDAIERYIDFLLRNPSIAQQIGLVNIVVNYVQNIGFLFSEG